MPAAPARDLLEAALAAQRTLEPAPTWPAASAAPQPADPPATAEAAAPTGASALPG